ncbi:amidase 1 [Aristolochia californica]|uniref:amidase 1 n=1 Tax=Aristolochia californica TaxID=171875 RepID=UPI0035D79A38
MTEQSEMAKEDFGAFIEKLLLLPPPNSDPGQLPLQGLTFAVKDIFDVKGYVTGFGNPDWARTHSSAISTSPVVLALLGAGATCVGKTIMDELAYSINGENEHYGTPINPCAPDRIPGGSSSGSAVAVAAGLCDFSLGTDTGGSVRVPAAFCHILGYRPSHGVVSTSGVIPMAQSFDTVGLFAKDPAILSQVGHVLLPLSDVVSTQPSSFIIPDDCFQLLSIPNDQVSGVLIKAIEKLFGGEIIHYAHLGDYISQNVPCLKHFMDISSENQESSTSLMALSQAMRLLQRYEFKKNHGEWVSTVKPDLGPGISERVSDAIKTSDKDIDLCFGVKSQLKAALTVLLKDNGILAIPTVPGPPPKLQTEGNMLETFRARAFSLLAISGVSGLCQVSIPLGMYNNLPVAISLVAGHGMDRFLLNVMKTLYDTLKEQSILAAQ